jgi:hypothetical protein
LQALSCLGLVFVAKRLLLLLLLLLLLMLLLLLLLMLLLLLPSCRLHGWLKKWLQRITGVGSAPLIAGNKGPGDWKGIGRFGGATAQLPEPERVKRYVPGAAAGPPAAVHDRNCTSVQSRQVCISGRAVGYLAL